MREAEVAQVAVISCVSEGDVITYEDGAARRGGARQTNRLVGWFVSTVSEPRRARPDAQKLPELASQFNTTITGLQRSGKYASCGPKVDFPGKFKTTLCTIKSQ